MKKSALDSFKVGEIIDLRIDASGPVWELFGNRIFVNGKNYIKVSTKDYGIRKFWKRNVLNYRRSII